MMGLGCGGSATLKHIAMVYWSAHFDRFDESLEVRFKLESVVAIPKGSHFIDLSFQIFLVLAGLGMNALHCRFTEWVGALLIRTLSTPMEPGTVKLKDTFGLGAKPSTK